MRLSHLTALAVMIALVGAMFVAMGSASAFEFGSCTVNASAAPATNYLLAGDTCTITVDSGNVAKVSDETIVSEDSGTLTAVAPGSATVTLETSATDATVARSYKIEVLSRPTISVTFDDTDAVVKAGTPVVATITTRGFSGNHRVVVSVPSTGLFFTAADSTADAQVEWVALVAPSQQIVYSSAPPTAVAGNTGFTVSSGAGGSIDGLAGKVILSTTGAPVGTFVVSASAASVDIDSSTDGDQVQKASTSATLTVGDPGKALASATLSLGTSSAMTAETGTDKAGDDGINLVIEAFNSLDTKANNGDVNTIIVSAIGSSDIKIGDLNSECGALTINEIPTMDGDEVGQKETVTVSKDEPGTVDVTATVIGAAGVATTETITLTFSGDAETHGTAAPGDALARENDVYQPAVEAVADTTLDDNIDQSVAAKDAVEGGLKFEVTGSDKAGNQSALTLAQITARVLDEDGKNVSSKFSIMEEIKANSNGIVVIRVGTGASKLAAGTYMLETRLTGKDTQKTEFAVSGAAGNIELEISVTPEPLELGSLVNVVATVTDANGTSVADGTPVDFASGGSLTLDNVGGIEDVPTDDGVAKARFIVSKGEGLATIIADAGSATGTATVTLMGEEPEAMPEEEAGLSCLSSLSGFSTWTCDVEASASEIFDWISSRGATALHLNSNRMWVRYSVVDGAMVPGSSDFMVTKSDILYISN